VEDWVEIRRHVRDSELLRQQSGRPVRCERGLSKGAVATRRGLLDGEGLSEIRSIVPVSRTPDPRNTDPYEMGEPMWNSSHSSYRRGHEFDSDRRYDFDHDRRYDDDDRHFAVYTATGTGRPTTTVGTGTDSAATRVAMTTAARRSTPDTAATAATGTTRSSSSTPGRARDEGRGSCRTDSPPANARSCRSAPPTAGRGRRRSGVPAPVDRR
jgi:hypothetical protein